MSSIAPRKPRAYRNVRNLPSDPLARFISKVSVVESGCWEWTGARVRGGYGKFFLRKEYRADWTKRSVLTPAHRWAYENWVGPIPAGLEIDHLCRNKGCVNPDHLEPVTRGENLRRIPRLPNCGRGHGFTPENTVYRIKRKRGARVLERECRECINLRARARYHRLKAS